MSIDPFVLYVAAIPLSLGNGSMFGRNVRSPALIGELNATSVATAIVVSRYFRGILMSFAFRDE